MERKLFKRLAELNTVANVNRKGRGDMNSDALRAAREVLCHPDHRSTVLGCSKGSHKNDLVRTLAVELVDSFQAMGRYLRQVGYCMERVDPHLRNNAGLVARLEDLEEAWENGHRYIQDKAMQDSLCRAVTVIEEVQFMLPEFMGMCVECDPEFFLVLPRIIWLDFLREPTQDTLLKALLPHYFGNSNATTRALESSRSMDLENLIDRFHSTQRVLVEAHGLESCQSKDFAMSAAWELLIRRAVLGQAPENDSMYEKLTPVRRDESRNAVDDFMRDLERWSIELQRHCPREWNECLTLLVKCYSHGSKKGREIVFCV